MPHSNSSSAASAVQKAAIYAASCNPPRKAKKPRIDTSTASLDGDLSSGTHGDAMARGAYTSSAASISAPSRPPNATSIAQNVRIRPAPPASGTLSVVTGHSSDITPTAIPLQATSSADSSTAPGPKKRGRKPGAMSRSARETQRKINHSRIEKARRSKINDALDALRTLVPAEFGKERPTAEDGKSTSLMEP